MDDSRYSCCYEFYKQDKIIIYVYINDSTYVCFCKF